MKSVTIQLTEAQHAKVRDAFRALQAEAKEEGKTLAAGEFLALALVLGAAAAKREGY